jgi:hypothetical protein
VARDVNIDNWPLANGDWSADGESVFMQSITSKDRPVILAVNEAGKAEDVWDGDANTTFWWLIQSPDGRYGILERRFPATTTPGWSKTSEPTSKLRLSDSRPEILYSLFVAR